MTRKTLIIGGASGIGFAVGTLLAGRGEEIMLAGRDSAKLDAARQRLSAHAASVSTLVLDISREAELVALSETLGCFPDWISVRQDRPLIQNSGEASMSPAISAGTSPPAVR